MAGARSDALAELIEGQPRWPQPRRSSSSRTQPGTQWVRRQPLPCARPCGEQSRQGFAVENPLCLLCLHPQATGSHGREGLSGLVHPHQRSQPPLPPKPASTPVSRQGRPRTRIEQPTASGSLKGAGAAEPRLAGAHAGQGQAGLGAGAGFPGCWVPPALLHCLGGGGQGQPLTGPLSPAGEPASPGREEAGAAINIAQLMYI